MDEHLTDAMITIILWAVLIKHLLNVVHVLVITAEQVVALVIVVVRLHASELVRHVIVVLLAAADGHAGDRAEHERQADESNVDENVRDILLLGEPEQIWIVWFSETCESHDVTDKKCDDRGRG